MASECKLLIKDYVYVRSIRISAFTDAHFSDENELVDFFSLVLWVLSRNPSSAMVSDISKRVPVRLLISCSTILHTGLNL